MRDAATVSTTAILVSLSIVFAMLLGFTRGRRQQDGCVAESVLSMMTTVQPPCVVNHN